MLPHGVNVDDELRRSARQEELREPFRLITWNMQGSGGNPAKLHLLRAYMKHQEFDAICLQECGALGRDWDDVVASYEAEMNYRGWGPRNIRCSLAVITRGHSREHEVPVDGDERRPLVGVEVRGKWIFTIHAPSGRDQRSRAAYIWSAVKAAGTQGAGHDWIIVGDFNDTPLAVQGYLAGFAAVDQRQVTVMGQGRGAAATQLGGRELDFAIHCGAGGCAVMPDAHWPGSDHIPVRVEWAPPAITRYLP